MIKKEYVKFNLPYGRKRFFKNYPDKLQEMLFLRQNNVSFPLLGKIYGLDHTTIIHQCKLHNIRPLPENQRISVVEILNSYGVENHNCRPVQNYPLPKEKVVVQLRVVEPIQFTHSKGFIDMEKRCEGKMYADYLKELQDRKFNRLLAKGKKK